MLTVGKGEEGLRDMRWQAQMTVGALFAHAGRLWAGGCAAQREIAGGDFFVRRKRGEEAGSDFWG